MDTLIDVKLSVMVVSEPRKSGTIVFIRNKTCRLDHVKVKRGILAMDLKVNDRVDTNLAFDQITPLES